jgi:adenosylhomocysteine nucleosidase
LLAVVAALKEEIGPLLKGGHFTSIPGPGTALCYEGEVAPGVATILMATGAGREHAEAAANWLVRQQRPDLVLCAGFAGATRPALETGTIVIGNSVTMLEGTPVQWSLPSLSPTIGSDNRWSAVARSLVEVYGIDFAQGTVVSVPIIARSPGLKRWVGEEFGVLSADMESYWLGAIARTANIPFLCVRVILDTMDMMLPELVSRIPRTPSGGRAGMAVSYALRRPGELRDLTRLKGASSRASASLAGFVPLFATEFHAQAAPVRRSA